MKKLLIITVLILASLSVRADVYTFDSITSYTNTGYQSVVNQLSMDVTPLIDGTTATLVIANEGPVISSVTQIYFDYAPETSVGLSAVAPAEWTYDTPPPNLPGGGGLFTSDFRLFAGNPPAQNGVTSGNSLEIMMSYNTGFDIIAALNSGELRVGLHTIGIIDTEGRLVGIDDDPSEGNVGDPWTYSESSINNIPEPASLVLLAGTSFLIGFIRRRFLV